MKKILAIILALCILFTGNVAYAQTSSSDLSTMSLSQLQEMYNSLLMQLIALLKQQLAVLQQNEGVNSGIVNRDETSTANITIYAVPDNTVTVDGVQYPNAQSVPIKTQMPTITITKNADFLDRTIPRPAAMNNTPSGDVKLASFVLVSDEDVDVLNVQFVVSNFPGNAEHIFKTPSYRVNNELSYYYQSSKFLGEFHMTADEPVVLDYYSKIDPRYITEEYVTSIVLNAYNTKHGYVHSLDVQGQALTLENN